jgi:hypothetical protein
VVCWAGGYELTRDIQRHTTGNQEVGASIPEPNLKARTHLLFRQREAFHAEAGGHQLLVVPEPNFGALCLLKISSQPKPELE